MTTTVTARATSTRAGQTDYVINTNLPPEAVNRIGIEIFKRWLDFALGKGALGGKSIRAPTGRYASSIQYRQMGEASVAIISDAAVAPEAMYLETGTRAYDMKKKFAGRVFPMHRGSGGVSFRPSMWASNRKAGFNGFAQVGPTKAKGQNAWIIPAMPAYAPARILTEIARQMANGGKAR